MLNFGRVICSPRNLWLPISWRVIRGGNFDLTDGRPDVNSAWIAVLKPPVERLGFLLKGSFRWKWEVG